MVDTFFILLKKGLVGTILLVFTFVILYVPQPYNRVEQAEAAWPVVLVGPSAIAIMANTAANVAMAKKESFLDGLANALARSFISNLTGSIVQWINSGFKGSPAFIGDLDGFLLNVADQAAGEYIASINDIGSFICSPFRLDIQIALSVKYQTAREGQPYRGCRLSDMVGNVEDFLEGEFSQGGWQDWFTIVAEPQLYTPYGQLLEAQAGMRASIRNAENKEIQVSSWGDGFLSGKLCEVIEGTGSAKPDPFAGSSLGGSQAAAGAKKERCTISKPGTVIANSLNKALGAGQDSLIQADEINEIIAALINQIAVQALTGAAGLLGLTASVNGSPSYINQMNQQSINQVGNLAGESDQVMESALRVQNQMNQLALNYIPRLQAFIANSRNNADRRNEATDTLYEATNVRDRSVQNAQRITDLLEDYDALEAQLTPNSTIAQQQAVKQQQIQVLQAFYQIDAYVEQDIRAATQAWESALRP